MSIFSEAARLEHENQPFALAQIVETKGSTPRHSAQMIVLPDGRIFGTIGGGMLERLVIEQAQEALVQRKPRMFRGRMTRTGDDAVGSDCGGLMDIYINVHGARPRLVLVGAGHVNRAVAASAAHLGFDLNVVDVYANNLKADRFPPGTRLVHDQGFAAACAKLPVAADDFVLIATNSHDVEVLRHFIRMPLRYLGLLASRRKVTAFRKALRAEGIGEEALERLHAPVGLDLGAETPEEIAIAVLAEILCVKHGADGGSMKDELRRRRGELVVVRGAGDIATGVALRLFRCGFRVIMLEAGQPTVIRRSVAFAPAVYDGSATVEGTTAFRVATAQDALDSAARGELSVLVDPEAASLAVLRPRYLIDAILAKRNLGTRRGVAPVTIALGPGFIAGEDCDAVIETHRGHRLGRVILAGPAQPNTGIPGEIAGQSDRRVVRAPCAGVFHSRVAIGDLVEAGTVLAHVGDTVVVSPLAGKVRGLLHDGLEVAAGLKIGDVDPRGPVADHLTVSDKALSIAGGVLEAMLQLGAKVPAPR